MTPRRLGRQLALQALYSWHYNASDIDVIVLFDWFDHQSEHYHLDSEKLRETKRYASELVRGTIAHCSDIDNTMSHFLKHWSINRLLMVDKAILRFSIYSLFHQPDIPVAVVINEAVELAKQFSDTNSPKFINGILDSASKHKVHSHNT